MPRQLGASESLYLQINRICRLSTSISGMGSPHPRWSRFVCIWRPANHDPPNISSQPTCYAGHLIQALDLFMSMSDGSSKSRLTLIKSSYVAAGVFSCLFVGFFRPDTIFFVFCLAASWPLAFASIYSFRTNVLFANGPHIQSTQFLLVGIIVSAILWLAILCYGLGTAWTLATGAERIVTMRITEKSSGSTRRRLCDYYIKAEGVTESIKLKTCLDKETWSKVSVGNEINFRVKSTSLGFISDKI